MNIFRIKKGYNSVSKTFRLPVELVGKLERLATDHNISLNQLVVQYLEFTLENFGNENKKEKHE